MTDPCHQEDSQIDKALGEDWPAKGAAVIEPTDEEINRLSVMLKLCPFCGSPCRLQYVPVPDFSGKSSKPKSISWHVECTSVGSRCPHGKHWLCSTSSGAVKAWNERAAL